MPSLPWILTPLIPAVIAIIAAGVASVSFNIPTSIFTRDMAALTRVPPYVSYISSMGILYWCAACAISAFAALFAKKEPSDDRSFLIASALLTFWLLFDDFFMFHESLAPIYLGIAESSVFIFYLIATGSYLLRFRKFIFASGFAWILGSALAFFTISAAADQLLEKFITDHVGHWEFLIEDGAKLIGLTFWLTFHALMAHAYIRKVIAQPISDERKKSSHKRH